jgi:hypothetical protein
MFQGYAYAYSNYRMCRLYTVSAVWCNAGRYSISCC